ncbi:MAG: glycosyltransferase family 4 protein [Vicinamibacterales bacterium]
MRSLHIDTARSWRGGQNQVRLTVAGLAAAGHPVVLMAHADGELLRRTAATVPVEPFTPRSEFDVQAAWRLGAVLDSFQPDVVHAHDPMAVALASMALQMRSATRPLLVAARRVDFHLKRHAFSKWKYRQVDVFIAASRLIAAILEQDGIAPTSIEIVHDGVDLQQIDQQPLVDAHAAFWLPHGAPLVGNVAALAPHKGQRYLVAAAARAVRELPDARFLIIGDGDLRGSLEHQIKSLGLERHVFLTGFRGDVIGLMKSLDLFVMSSVTEGLGSAILEAMACERAVVGTHTGGIPEAVLHERTGLLVPPHDETALADAMVRLLRDPALRQSLGTEGRVRVTEEFSADRMVSRTAAVYAKWLATPR